MSEPQRLLDEGGDDLSLSLLRSARGDGPSPHARRKTMVALGLAGGVGAGVTAATATGAASTMAKSSATAALAKWIGMGVIGGIVTVGTVEVVQTKSTPAVTQGAAINAGPVAKTKPAKGLAPAAVNDAPTAEPAPIEAEVPPPAVEEPAAKPSAAPVEAPRATARPADKPTLADEVAALDAARVALSSGNAAAALRALDDHDRRFPGGVLGMEATVLRIEALVARGDRASASRLGRTFLDAHPRSPHASRVRTLIGATDEVAPATP